MVLIKKNEEIVNSGNTIVHSRVYWECKDRGRP